MQKTKSPWASGPGEILRHGLELLKKDSDTNRRLAMISIDNAVELMVKTYVGLPKRITGLAISRREFQEISESFSDLLDALEKYSADKLDGVDLGAIEWYHRLRNQLYHQGNGLTVERDKVEIYAELANVLFKNLFGVELVEQRSPRTELLGEFMAAWVLLERGLRKMAGGQSGPLWSPTLDVMRQLEAAKRLNSREVAEIAELRNTRNIVAHGAAEWQAKLTPHALERVQHYARKFGEQQADSL